MLLDMLSQLFGSMCSEDDSSHLPNLPPGKQVIKEWVQLHTTCCELGLHKDDSVIKYGTRLDSSQTGVNVVITADSVPLPAVTEEVSFNAKPSLVSSSQAEPVSCNGSCDINTDTASGEINTTSNGEINSSVETVEAKASSCTSSENVNSSTDHGACSNSSEVIT